jgi:hypothetical protein
MKELSLAILRSQNKKIELNAGDKGFSILTEHKRLTGISPVLPPDS